MNKYSITVAIITRNRADLLDQCLTALEKQTVKPDNIIIVDNASSDNTRQVVDKFSKSFKIQYYFESKIGIPISRNLAIKNCKNSILAFTDDDCVPPPDWVNQHIKAHKKFPRVSAVQGYTLPKDRSHIFAILYEMNYSFWLHVNVDENGYIKVGDTNNFSVKIAIIRKTGLYFDESISRGSDVDFAKQLINEGKKIIFQPHVLNEHVTRKNFYKLLKQHYMNGQSQAVIQQKWAVDFKSTDKENQEYLKLKRSIGQNLPWYKQILLRNVYKIYNPFFQLGFKLKCKQLKDVVYQVKINRPVRNITVAIVTRNRAHFLKRALKTILKQPLYPREIVIVDNASTDNTKEIVKAFSKIIPIKYVLEKRIGSPYARNKAIKYASSELLAFLDDDCEAQYNWIEEIVKAHKKYPKVAAIQGKCVIYPISGMLSRVLKDDYERWFQSNCLKGGRLLVMDTANTSFKLSVLKRFSIKFDSIFSKYCDDLDFANQIIYKGLSIQYCPSILIHSWRRTSLIEYFKERFKKGIAKAKLDNKWYREVYPFGVILKGRKIEVLSRNTPQHEQIRMNMYTSLSAFLKPVLQKLKHENRVMYLTYHFISHIYHNLFLYGYSIQKKAINYTELENYNASRMGMTSSKLKKLKLSIMIITKDRMEGLEKTLQSLTLQTVKPYEVIIVDSSKIPCQKSVNAFRNKLSIRYLYQPKPGFGIARNSALDVANGDILATIDDDAQAPVEWSERIISAHNRFPNDLAVQGRIICSPENSPYALVEQTRLDQWFIHEIDKGSIKTISTKNVSLKLRKLRKLNIRFIENSYMGKYGSEDKELAIQILQKGNSIRYCSDIAVYHFERGTFTQYLKQQYRKGCARGITDAALNSVFVNRGGMYQRLKGYFFDLAARPILQGDKRRFSIVFFIYLISIFSYNIGRNIMFHYINVKYPYFALEVSKIKITKQKTRQLTVAIFVNSDKDKIDRVLYAIVKQTILPEKVYIIDLINAQGTELRTLKYRKYLNIENINLEGIKLGSARNLLIQRAQTKFIAFLDGMSLPETNWVEEVISFCRKNPGNPLVQGGVVNKKTDNVYSVINQFNRQTLIRNIMSGERNDYWNWIDGKLDRSFTIKLFDVVNTVMDVDVFKKNRITFNEKLEINQEIDFGNKIARNGISILMYPKIKVLYLAQGSIYEVIKYGIKNGQILDFISRTWTTTEINSINRNLSRRWLSFIYYCFANGYVLVFPLLFLSFLIFQISTYLGLMKSRNSENHSLNIKPLIQSMK